MEFGNKLYELRKAKGLSQEDLASRLDVTRQTVFTLATYTHATNKAQEQAAAKMGDLLKQAL